MRAEDKLPQVEMPGDRVNLATLRTIVMRYVTAGTMVAERRVLEIGCGPGIGLDYFCHCGARHVTGIDLNTDLLRIARHSSSPHIKLARCDAAHLPFRSASFDVVLLFEVIMYLSDPAAVFRECRRILTDGGVFMLTLPNKEKTGFISSPGTVAYYSGVELTALLETAGFASQIFGVFPSKDPTTAESTGYLWAKRLLNLLNRCGLPPTVRARLSGTILKKNLHVPQHIHASHRDLVLPQDGLITACGGTVHSHRVLYGIGTKRTTPAGDR